MANVKVDRTKCTGCGVCVDSCPVQVFELQDLPNFPASKKSVPVREKDCIMCMTCVTSCPVGAITVEE
jgi:ferredoxin